MNGDDDYDYANLDLDVPLTPVDDMDLSDLYGELSDRLHATRLEVQIVADAMGVLGMKASHQLYQQVTSLKRMSQLASALATKASDELLDAARQGTANMLSMALAIPQIVERSRAQDSHDPSG